MAPTKQASGTVFQAWFPHPLDEQLRKHAESERRSLSSTIRIAVEDSFAEASGEGRAPAGQDLLVHRPARGAGRKEETR